MSSLPDPPEPPSRFQLRVKAATVVTTAIVAGLCILYDWDSATGTETVFSAIRPAVKRALNKVYGVESKQPEEKR